MSFHKPCVVFWKNIPSPYSVERFNVLADRGNLDFEVWFNQIRESDRSWDVNESDWRFRARYIPKRSFLSRQLHLPLSEIYRVRPDILVSLYYEASFALGTLAARSLVPQIIYDVMPNFDTWSERTWWREVAKHILFRSVDGVKVTGSDAIQLTEKYGMTASRSHFVTQSIDVAHYSKAKDIKPEVRRQRREQLGLHGCVFLYVGRIWKGKGLDYLFEAYKAVRSKQPDVSMLLLGDGVDEERYRAMAQELPDVVFAGFVQACDMPAYYALGDVLVFPTLGDPYGHVVGESMAAGLPVISTESAGEIRRRISDGVDGFIAPPANSSALAERMLQLADDPTLRMKLVANASQHVNSITHEDFARDFEALVDRVLSIPPRRTPMSIIARALGWCLLTVGGEKGQPAPYANKKAMDVP